MSFVKVIASANRMFRLDNGIYARNVLKGTCAGSCPSPLGSAPEGCELVRCKYLGAQDWSSLGYTYNAINGDATTSSPCQGSAPVNNYVACAKRSVGESPCTDKKTYKAWGYAVDRNGNVISLGGAPQPKS